jgi:hypothetical protein
MLAKIWAHLIYSALNMQEHNNHNITLRTTSSPDSASISNDDCSLDKQCGESLSLDTLVRLVLRKDFEKLAHPRDRVYGMYEAKREI